MTQARDRNVPIRVITTTYVGSTERRAVDELVRRFGATVKISYETGLHAAARQGMAFPAKQRVRHRLRRQLQPLAVGDRRRARVERPAVSGVATPDLIRKLEATFDTYWADTAFSPYDPDLDARPAGRRARQGRQPRSRSAVIISLSGLEVRPYPHQEQMLEALDTERQIHDRHRNLVVAATGTGKTVIAALDYRRLVREARPPGLAAVRRPPPGDPDQSLRTYREALADGDFGELYVGGARPERWRHVFASIQSLASYGVERLRSRPLRCRRRRRVPPR